MSSFEKDNQNSLKGSTDRLYINFFFFFLYTGFIAPLWGIILIVLSVLVFIIGTEPSRVTISAFDLLINPLNIYLVIWIITVICLKMTMQKRGTIQEQNLSRKQFYVKPFLSVILIWILLFSGFSLVFDEMSSDPNPNGGCDICGGTAFFGYSVNDVVMYRYCEWHAMDKAFLDPRSLIGPLIHRGINTSTSVIFGALIGVYTWIFVIGFALILGSGYTWEKNWERNFLKRIDYKINKQYSDIKNTIKKFFEIYRNE